MRKLLAGNSLPASGRRATLPLAAAAHIMYGAAEPYIAAEAASLLGSRRHVCLASLLWRRRVDEGLVDPVEGLRGRRSPQHVRASSRCANLCRLQMYRCKPIRQHVNATSSTLESCNGSNACLDQEDGCCCCCGAPHDRPARVVRRNELLEVVRLRGPRLASVR